MIGQYETGRDEFQQTDCWLAENDHCEPHFHSSYELTYVLSGRMTGMVNGTQYQLSGDELLLSPGYSLHRYTSDLGDAQSLVMTVPLDFVPSFKKLMATQQFRDRHASLKPGNALIGTLSALEKALHAGNANDFLIKGYTYTVIGLLIGILGLVPRSESKGEDFARNVLVYLDAHYLEELTAASVAAQFGYSASHFMHLFSDSFGFGLRAYVNILRCRNAAMLMADASPLIDAAFSSGFSSMRSFYRNFKHVFGMTPTEYLGDRKKSAGRNP